MTPDAVPGLGYLIAALLVMFAVTQLLRAAPFVALARLQGSSYVRYLGVTMPAGVMVVLVVYTLQDTTTEVASWLPAAGGLAATFGTHAALKRAAVSVVAGTAAFMLLTALL